MTWRTISLTLPKWTTMVLKPTQLLLFGFVDTCCGNFEWSSRWGVMSGDKKEAKTVQWIWSFLPSNSELCGWPKPWIVLEARQRCMANLSPTMAEGAWQKAAGMLPIWNFLVVPMLTAKTEVDFSRQETLRETFSWDCWCKPHWQHDRQGMQLWLLLSLLLIMLKTDDCKI